MQVRQACMCAKQWPGSTPASVSAAVLKVYRCTRGRRPLHVAGSKAPLNASTNSMADAGRFMTACCRASEGTWEDTWLRSDSRVFRDCNLPEQPLSRLACSDKGYDAALGGASTTDVNSLGPGLETASVNKHSDPAHILRSCTDYAQPSCSRTLLTHPAHTLQIVHAKHAHTQPH